MASNRGAAIEQLSLDGSRLAVSFRELVAAAACIADRIASHDFESGRVVAVLVEDGLLLVLCQFAVLLSRHAFLLVDPSLPPARRSYLLSDPQHPEFRDENVTDASVTRR